MPLSIDINLPRDQEPLFPARCVGCGVESPTATIRIRTRAIGWWLLTLWNFGKRYTIEIPACSDCRRAVHRKRWQMGLLTASCATIGVAVGLWLLPDYDGPLKRWLFVGIAVCATAPVILWQVLNPPPVDVTAFPKTIDYEFRERAYAEEFAALNDARIDE